MDEKIKVVASFDYIDLYEDGTIGISDGVGYIGEMSEHDVKKLFLHLNNLYYKKPIDNK